MNHNCKKSTFACSFKVSCDLYSARLACLEAREFLTRSGLPNKDISQWELALTEAVNNAVEHCRPEAKKLAIIVDAIITANQVEIRITDHTPGFELPEKAALPPDESESGRGIFLIQNLTDSAHYLRGREENCLVLRKERSTATEIAPTQDEPAMAEELRSAQHTLDLMTEELSSSYESLSAIFRFTSELQGGTTTVQFIQRWLDQLLTITESDWYVLRLCDTSPAQLRVAVTSAPKWQHQPLLLTDSAETSVSVEAQAAIEQNDVWFDLSSPLGNHDPLETLSAHSCGFAHPLLINNTCVGVLTVGRHEHCRAYQSGQVSVIQTFGDFLGIQIHSDKLQEEQVRARLNARDLEIAASIQRALLPSQLPSAAGAALSGYYRSAREIGGDYYDALPTENGNMLLVVADVMGKGLPAALFSLMFRSLVRARRDLSSKPDEFLTWLNQNLYEELSRAEMFITAQLVYLDFQTGVMSVAGAGHPPLLFAAPDGSIKEAPSDGPPLGILAEVNFPAVRHPLAGLRALMFTDGLMESRNKNGDLLGLDAVKSELAKAAEKELPIEAVHQNLARLLHDFEQGTSPADDTAFILISGK